MKRSQAPHLQQKAECAPSTATSLSRSFSQNPTMMSMYVHLHIYIYVLIKKIFIGLSCRLKNSIQSDFSLLGKKLQQFTNSAHLQSHFFYVGSSFSQLNPYGAKPEEEECTTKGRACRVQKGLLRAAR